MTIQYYSNKGRIVTVVTNAKGGKILLKTLIKLGTDILEVRG